ncbi:hypothetical protein [Burkholderia pyrrocinia]|uniref:hypothetical protein n=1 Tax=Burkholderia pyrrocinia TaxID=60550 RepID=UPI00158E50CD|nr:hypothetical protein [Burkholderia pyrrocinia]
MTSQAATREALALRVLAQASVLVKRERLDPTHTRNLRAKLSHLKATSASTLVDSLRLRSETTQANPNTTESLLHRACEEALGDFSLESAQVLLDAGQRYFDVLPRTADVTMRAPSLYAFVIRRIEESGFHADLADLEMPLSVAGQQLVALLLEGQSWPVLVTDGDVAPIVGPLTAPDTKASDETVGLAGDTSPSAVLERMRAEANRILRSGGEIEEREPAAAMAGMMSSLAAWLPFRTTARDTPAGGSGGAAGGIGNSSAPRGEGTSSGYRASLIATSIAGGYSPNFGVDTRHPDCSVASSPAFIACFSHFGGPVTPVRRFLNVGNYLFEATAWDGRTYRTPYKVKVPDCDPLNLPFP